MAHTIKLTTQQIGKLGELLVQYRLLSLGIESAHLTTDSGIDLVAYSPNRKSALTIQVKTNLQPKPGGGKGKAALDWWIPQDSPAELFALVDLSEQRIWLFDLPELEACAQQQSSGRFHLYMYTDLTVTRRNNTKASIVSEFEKFALENHVHDFL